MEYWKLQLPQYRRQTQACNYRHADKGRDGAGNPQRLQDEVHRGAGDRGGGVQVSAM